MSKAKTSVSDAVVYMLSVPGLILLHVSCGWLSGWIAGLMFGDTILGILGQLGIHDITMGQLGIHDITMGQYGAFLGFTSGFLKTRTEVKVKKDE